MRKLHVLVLVLVFILGASLPMNKAQGGRCGNPSGYSGSGDSCTCLYGLCGFTSGDCCQLEECGCSPTRRPSGFVSQAHRLGFLLKEAECDA